MGMKDLKVNNILPGYVLEIFSFMLLQKYIKKNFKKILSYE